MAQLAKHCGKSPGLLTEEGLRQYFLYLSNDKHPGGRELPLVDFADPNDRF